MARRMAFDGQLRTTGMADIKLTATTSATTLNETQEAP